MSGFASSHQVYALGILSMIIIEQNTGSTMDEMVKAGIISKLVNFVCQIEYVDDRISRIVEVALFAMHTIAEHSSQYKKELAATGTMTHLSYGMQANHQV